MHPSPRQTSPISLDKLGSPRAYRMRRARADAPGRPPVSRTKGETREPYLLRFVISSPRAASPVLGRPGAEGARAGRQGRDNGHINPVLGIPVADHDVHAAVRR
eukprot:11483802-Alexandrium_andersonii.AAC.1